MDATLAMIKTLREQTGVGIMDCKVALKASDSLDDAVRYLREKGLAKAVKKADRDATSGAVFISLSDDATSGAIIQLRCETDFVAKNSVFQAFGQSLAEALLTQETPDLILLDGQNLETAIAAIVSQTGESVSIAHYARIHAPHVSGYSHLNGNMAAIIGLSKPLDAARSLAMQVVASNPAYAYPEDVPEAVLTHEKSILREQAVQAGKPEKVIDQIVSGMINKYYEEQCLANQVYIKDPDIKISALLGDTKVIEFKRFSV